ncbi:probable 4-coumarate--CoA ligase 3 [Lutzomyia longipalpis]|uniref:probable 4-coumarate--CoA ligase 3 n=1 Tax=Lutzomyia longipalpis TaxID=7200 RepID=UPI002483E4FE|nr:probable 4-coumarate--CoA ligase 3 [Lutzomyia longipalpis]
MIRRFKSFKSFQYSGQTQSKKMSITKYFSEEKIWRGPEKPAWLFNEKANLGRILLSILNRDPQKVAQISDNNGIRMTNGEMVSYAEKIAGGLKQRGCKVGDVVGFVAANGHMLAPTLIACFLLEASTNAMDVNQNEDEIYNIFKITEPKFIFCDAQKINLMEKVAGRLQDSPTIIIYGENKVKAYISIEDLIREGDDEVLRRNILLEACRPLQMDYNIICCSSGTTGPQKAVCISYQSIVDEYWYQNVVRSSEGSFFTFSSVFWTVGYLVLLRSIFYGLTRIITTQDFNPELFLNIITKYRVTNTLINPLLLCQVLESPKLSPDTFSSLKKIFCCGNIITEDLVEKLKPFLMSKTKFMIIYGSTEAGAITTYNYNLKGTISVGNLLPGIEGIVIDEEGRRLGPGMVGELCFTTPYRFSGYLKNPEATNAYTTNDGFMRSGDLGFYDEDGLLYVNGRCKDVMKYILAHVSGSEIERVVKKHPSVSDVVAVGIPDEKYSHLPAVLVVLKNRSSVTAEEISDLVAEKLPDSHKLRGGVYFVDKIPVTSTGKVKKVEAEKYAERMFRSLNLKD